MPRDNHESSDAFDRAYERDLEQEPTYSPAKRQRIPLVTGGALKQWWQERQRIGKVR